MMLEKGVNNKFVQLSFPVWLSTASLIMLKGKLYKLGCMRQS